MQKPLIKKGKTMKGETVHIETTIDEIYENAFGQSKSLSDLLSLSECFTLHVVYCTNYRKKYVPSCHSQQVRIIVHEGELPAQKNYVMEFIRE